MAETHRFTLKDIVTYLGKSCLCLFYYEQQAGEEGAEALANAYFDTIVPLMIEVQHTGAVHSAIEVKNLDDNEDFYTLVPSSGNVGLVTGEGLPRYNAWGFRKNRANSSFRNGAFRVPGLSEQSQANGVANSGTLEDLGTLADAMGNVLVGAASDRWILRTPSGTFVGGAIPVPTPISSVQYIRMTTQNSRKD